MWGTSHWLLLCAAVASACGTGETRVDPADLEVRDLLGVAPEVAAHWDAGQREAARHVLDHALHAQVAPQKLTDTGALEERLADLDARRADGGDDALGLVVVDGAVVTPVATDLADTARRLDIALDDGWSAQPVGPERGLGVLATFAGDAGHTSGPLTLVPGPRLATIAAYEHGRLIVNPVVLAALEPTTAPLNATVASGGASGDGTAARIAKPGGHTANPIDEAVESAANGTIGNPYSFYGSVAECAAAQRSRCEACMPSNNCVPVTDTSDGNAECTTLAANGGRGYYLLCINAALAITSVDTCAAKQAASCPRDTKAAAQLSDLEANADFLDMVDCSTGLDACLASIYGKPSGTFPGPGVDAGTSEPPRSTNVSCGDSCSNDKNCEASPNCSCSGPSCNNSLSCDSTCASSNNSSGCSSSNCDTCNSSSSSSGGGGGGGCSSSSSSGGSSGGGGCNSCSSSSSSSGGSSGGGCNSCSSSSSSGGGGSSGCGGCSNTSSGSSGSSNSSCGGSGGGKCSVARGEPNAAFALLLSIMWGVLPVPFAARARRRARRQRSAAPPEPASPDAQQNAKEVQS